MVNRKWTLETWENVQGESLDDAIDFIRGWGWWWPWFLMFRVFYFLFVAEYDFFRKKEILMMFLRHKLSLTFVIMFRVPHTNPSVPSLSSHFFRLETFCSIPPSQTKSLIPRPLGCASFIYTHTHTHKIKEYTRGI